MLDAKCSDTLSGIVERTSQIVSKRTLNMKEMKSVDGEGAEDSLHPDVLEKVYHYSAWQPLLSQAFLSGLPTTRPLWTRAFEHIPDNLTVEQQLVLNKLVLAATLLHRLALKYPRCEAYSKISLEKIKTVFAELEYQTYHINQALSILSESSDIEQPQLTYKTYLIEESSANRYLNARVDVERAFKDLQEGPNSYTEFSNGDLHVSLLESVEGIAYNTTGLTSWGGGAVMAQWINSNKHILQNKNVLELGSGVGYLASVILKNNHVLDSTGNLDSEIQPNTSRLNSYTATDCHPHVLEILYHNLLISGEKKISGYESLKIHQNMICKKLAAEEIPAGSDPLAEAWTSPSALPSYDGVPLQVMVSINLLPMHTMRVTQVKYLDWREPDYSSLPPCDVIIAADVVYAKHLMGYLAKLIKGILSRNSKDDVTPSAYFACTRRNTETISSFLSALEEEDLTHSLVYQATLDTESSFFVYNESHIPVKIYRIEMS